MNQEYREAFQGEALHHMGNVNVKELSYSECIKEIASSMGIKASHEKALARGAFYCPLLAPFWLESEKEICQVFREAYAKRKAQGELA